MAYDQGVTPTTFLSASDLSTKQFQFVTLSSTGLALTADAAAADGVLLDKPNAAGIPGNCATVAGQVCRIMAGAAFAAGAYLEVASGKAVTLAAGKIVARAVSAATASGDIVPALLIFQR